MGADLRDYNPERLNWGRLRDYLTREQQHYERLALACVGQSGERDMRLEANAKASALRDVLAEMKRLATR